MGRIVTKRKGKKVVLVGFDVSGTPVFDQIAKPSEYQGRVHFGADGNRFRRINAIRKLVGSLRDSEGHVLWEFENTYDEFGELQGSHVRGEDGREKSLDLKRWQLNIRDGLLAIVGGAMAAVAIVVAGAAALELLHSCEVDRCLHRGGRWEHEPYRCEFDGGDR